jgi:hypothetical protein
MLHSSLPKGKRNPDMNLSQFEEPIWHWGGSDARVRAALGSEPGLDDPSHRHLQSLAFSAGQPSA